MDVAWDASPAKPIGKDRKEGGDVKEEDDADMGAARAQGLAPGIPRREVEDSSEDVHVGNGHKDDVQACGEQGSGQPIPDVDGDVGTGQTGDAHVLTKRVGYDVDPTVVQALEEKDGWKHDDEAAGQRGGGDLPNDLAGEDGGVSQRGADGHVAIEGHGQEHCRVSHEEEVDEEHLGEAAIKGDVARTEPEGGQGFGHGGCGQQDVGTGQHGQKDVHGPMQAWLGDDDTDQNAVACQGSYIHGAEGNGEPDLKVLQPWDAGKEASGPASIRVVHSSYVVSREKGHGALQSPPLGHKKKRGFRLSLYQQSAHTGLQSGRSRGGSVG